MPLPREVAGPGHQKSGGITGKGPAVAALGGCKGWEVSNSDSLVCQRLAAGLCTLSLSLPAHVAWYACTIAHCYNCHWVL